MLTVDAGTTASYVYGPGGRRVRSTTWGSSRDYLYDQGGHAITTIYPGGWGPGEVFAGNLHVATYSNGTTYSMHTDWLGTIRNQTTVAGSSAQVASSLPFGDAFNAPGGALTPLYFTERTVGELQRTVAGRVFECELVPEPVRGAAENCGVAAGVQRRTAA